MTGQGRSCAALSCSAQVDRNTPFCRRHWNKLPGKLRSRISMSATAKDSAVRTDEIGRAVRLLGVIS
ncbi:hypothetical protein EWE75_10040 [Sphingomonas populi]|uniref:Uncharacterized protein n=1 Tax=Sphingomonas populi TaxID=2484750 RepID=A0A4V2DDC5_9SPHN|nr:hypothetical protein [Sphingomonas populi]RZF64508.1 hypothetical protein EWE75_10040 [Sphingomonas populi]